METLNRNTFNDKINFLISQNSLQFDQEASTESIHFIGNGANVEKVLLTSYPRSGNTLIRSYLEKITSIYTGSDCDISRKLNKELLEMGMIGEGKINDEVWIVKTHYPERIGHSEFKAHKCIVIVRSPIDCISSLFNMIATGSHTDSIPEDKLPLVSHIWTSFVKEEIAVWRDFHDFWTKSPQSIPTHLVRYEDLLMRPEAALTEIFKFLLNQTDISNMKISQIIHQVTNDSKKPEVYKPRVGKINASKKYYTKELLEYMRKTAYREIRRFGYLKMKLDINETGFISEDDDNNPLEAGEKTDHLAWFNDFNNKMLSGAIKIKEQFGQSYMDRVHIVVNKRGEIVRKKSKEDPTARGFRKYKQILRDTLN